jgi:hypothetical protein
LSLIGKRANDELNRILYDVHGDRPIFGYPVLSFENKAEIESVSEISKNMKNIRTVLIYYYSMEKNNPKIHLTQLENKLWKYIGKDILDKYKPIEKVFLINI